MRSVRRIVRKEIKKALAFLEAKPYLKDEAIHDARKGMKRARAALRLMRESLPTKKYRQGNRRLRDASRTLSEVRNANVLVGAFDDLLKRGAPADRRELSGFRAILVSARKESRKKVLGDNRAGLKSIQGALLSARKQMKSWPAGRRWSLLSPGLRRVYRSGRAALAMARREPTVENLHECRKQAKYLWEELEFLVAINPPRMGALGDRAHALSDHIGDDHDLALLEMRLVAEGTQLRAATLEKLLARIQARRRTLQAKARIVGNRVYAKRPQAFMRMLERYRRTRRRAG